MAAVETPAVMPPTPTQRTPAVNITEDFVYRLAKLEAAQELRHSQLLEKIDQQTAFFKSMFTRIFETLQADSNHNSPEEYLNADERSHKIIGDEHMYEYADENCIPSDSDNSPPDAITAEKVHTRRTFLLNVVSSFFHITTKPQISRECTTIEQYRFGMRLDIA